MSTKKLISDSVLYKLAGGVPDGSFPVDERDIWASLENRVNAMFKMQHFSVNLPSGETIPDSLFLATYENITLSRTSNERCKFTLPVTPVSLPRMMGINEIRPVLSVVESGDKILGNPIIPLQAGQTFLLQSDQLLNDLQGLWSCEVSGKTVFISKDLTTYNISKVDIKLVVFEIGSYAITDELPVPADMVAQLEDELVAEFARVLPENGLVNNYSNAGQITPQNTGNK